VTAATGKEIAEYVKAESIPLILPFNMDYVDLIFADARKGFILFTEDKDAGYQEVYRQAALANPDYLFYTTETGIKGEMETIIGTMTNVKEEDVPAIRFINPDNEKRKYFKYKFESDVRTMTTDDITKFLEDFKNGNATQALKSEPIPKVQLVDGMTTLVGENYAEFVADTDKEIMVMFYAPWCSWCKAAMPIWEELAKELADIEDLIIARIDATQNEVAEFDITGYPTFKWYRKDRYMTYDYVEKQTLEGFKDYFFDMSPAFRRARPDYVKSAKPEEKSDGNMDVDLSALETEQAEEVEWKDVPVVTQAAETQPEPQSDAV